MQQPSHLSAKVWLALGDSYTIGESVPETDRYPVQARDLLKKAGLIFDPPEIIATTGWTTADLLQALKKPTIHRRYDLVTLLIGVNNQYQGRTLAEYSAEFRQLLHLALVFAGGFKDHVLVLSIPDYSVTPFAASHDRKAIAEGIDAFNALNKEISQQRQVQYLDITADSRKAANDPALVAADGLHFSGKEYAEWAAKLVEKVKGLWGESNGQ